MSYDKAKIKNRKKNIVTYTMVILAYLFIKFLELTGNLSNSLMGQLVPITTYIVLAVSLNLTVGILGELSLGHAAFMGIGAFSGAILASSLNFPELPNLLILIFSILLGTILAGLFGLLIGIPALRLKGDYLAIVTLAFGEIIKNIINTLYISVGPGGLKISMSDHSEEALALGRKVIVRGPIGAVGINKISTFDVGFVLVLITLFVVLNLIDSRAGRAIMSLRDNSIAAQSVGINVTKYKLTAFMISSALAGGAGAFYALNYSTVVAKKFDFNTSILILVFVVLGGIGNIRGSIIAATVLTVIPELLRAFSDYRMLSYAVLLILIMLASNNEYVNQFRRKIKIKAKEIQKKLFGKIKFLNGNFGFFGEHPDKGEKK